MNIMIIGATSGIGHNLWRHYASMKHNVIVTGRRKELLAEMERELPEHTQSVLCDISETEAGWTFGVMDCISKVLSGHFG